MNRIRSPSSSSTRRLHANSMSSTAPGASGSSSVTEGAPSAATATSVSRTCSGSALSRSATRARRLSGRSTCRPSSRIVPSVSARPISSAKNGFPPAASCTRDEYRPRQVERQPAPQEPVDRPDRERRDRKPPEPGEGAVELERRLDRAPAHRRQHTHRLGLQPPEHEAEDLRRACIDPLRVVDRDEQRPILDEDPHDGQQRRGEQPCLRRRPVGLADQERDLQRTALDRHESRQRLVQHRREQVADGREGRAQLGMGRARGEDAHSSRSRARRAPSCQSAVLPIPASPSNSNADPPAGTASRNSPSTTSSLRLPTICSAMCPHLRAAAHPLCRASHASRAHGSSQTAATNVGCITVCLLELQRQRPDTVWASRSPGEGSEPWPRTRRCSSGWWGWGGWAPGSSGG